LLKSHFGFVMQSAQARKEAALRAHAENLERARREYHQDRMAAEQRRRDNAGSAPQAAAGGAAGGRNAIPRGDKLARDDGPPAVVSDTIDSPPAEPDKQPADKPAARVPLLVVSSTPHVLTLPLCAVC
jgi:hypothetical protein